jgi:NTE family protein
VPPVVALSGLLPKGRGNLEPIHKMLDTVVAESLPNADWPSRPTWVVATDYSSGLRVVFGRDGSPPAPLADAVCASCSIPAWYQPVRIDSRAYIDGGTASNASVDLVAEGEYDEIYVLAPMAALSPDSPRSPVAMVERRVRRSITRGIMHDVKPLRESGSRVMVLTPGPDDLEVMGANLMNPRRRTAVLQTSLRTAAAEIRSQTRRDQSGLPDTGTS